MENTVTGEVVDESEYVERTFRKFVSEDIARDAPGEVVLLNGNESISRGAIEAGISVATSYPGSPATYILENVAAAAKQHRIHAEWSTNEKVAYEVAFGAAAAGAKALFACKNVGMNWIMDPLINSVTLGLKGALVLAVVDDPGADVTTDEQDSRFLAMFTEIPILEPSSPQESKDMTLEAFRISEQIKIPVMVRPIRQLTYARGNVKLGPINAKTVSKLDKSMRYVCGIGMVVSARHAMFHSKTFRQLEAFVEETPLNEVKLKGREKLGVITAGLCYAYMIEALKRLDVSEDEIAWLKLGVSYPLPREKISNLLQSVDKVLVIEEVEPFIENQVKAIAADLQKHATIYGKKTGHLPVGELDVHQVSKVISAFLRVELRSEVPKEHITKAKTIASALPFRSPGAFCPGCPHIASLYSLKMTAEKLFRNNYNIHGDIGCYQLAILPPYSFVDTCLCMGAGLGIGSGVYFSGAPGKNIVTLGDSTFLHAGIPGLINAVYNRADLTLVILDNRTTGATGHQPHPGAFGVTATGEETKQLDIAEIVKALKVDMVRVVDPYNVKETCAAFEDALGKKGVTVVVCRRVCAVVAERQRGGLGVYKPQKYQVDQNMCSTCGICVDRFGCPSIIQAEKQGKPAIDESTCFGCGVCAQICPTEAIRIK
nr:indolepyruvate ferredoxin oxidoreductase subunit alpha [Candidatus Njordarchaeum guaymaensis]